MICPNPFELTPRPRTTLRAARGVAALLGSLLASVALALPTPSAPASAKTPAQPVPKAPAKPAPKPSARAPAKPAAKAAPKAAPKSAAKGPAKASAKPVVRPAALPAKVAGAGVAAAGVAVAASAAAPVAWTDLATWCSRVTDHLAGMASARCQRTGLQVGDGRSVQGVPLWHRDVRPVGPAALRVLVLGGIHGDEMTSVNVVFDWLERALRRAEPGIHWRMVPLVNPDGLMRRPATRVNARGVDLNRNFPTPDWERAAQTYWVSRTGKDPRRFPGPKAMSEPETQWVQRQLDQFQPHLIVSVHAPYGVLDFDGPPPPPEKLGSLHLDQVGIYPGSLGNYGGVVRRVPVVTLELRNARQVADAEVGAMWSDLLDWIDRRRDHMAALKPLDEDRGPLRPR